MSSVTVRVEGSFPHKHLKRGHHTFFLPVDPEALKLVGMVVAYWGAFELRMDALIWEFAKALGKSLAKDWERQTFKKRKETFREFSGGYTRLMFPAWEKRLGNLVTSAGDLHWRRNIVAHGLYEVEPIQTDPASYRMVASGIVKGKIRRIPIDEQTMSKLWHDIAHLLGDLMVFVNHTGAKTSSLDLVFPDDDLLPLAPEGAFRVLALPEILQSDRQNGKK